MHIIDPQNAYCSKIASMIRRMGHDCSVSSSFSEGLKAARDTPTEIVLIVDSSTPEECVPLNLTEVAHWPEAPDSIVISINGNTPRRAQAAFQAGVWDYLTAPVSFVDFEQTVSRCLKHREAKRHFLQNAQIERSKIVGQGSKIKRVLDKLSMIARTRGNVLILGETGAGKDLFAQAIHNNSDRSDRPFVVVDCTNLPETLAESILFGHARGAFTDAKEASVGLFKQADGGTIFLDEIGDLSLGVQKSLLRVLQEHVFRPLKSTKEEHSDFRLVAATNRDLVAMLEAGTFRKDLYYRLKNTVIELPPLRERDEDVFLLARHFADEICEKDGLALKRFSKDFVTAIKQYDWPGNVRELLNVMHETIYNSFGVSTLHQHHLPGEIRAFLVCNTATQDTLNNEICCIDSILHDVLMCEEEFPSLKQVRQRVTEQMEAEYVFELLRHSEKKMSSACKIAGVSRARLYGLIRKHGFSLH